MPTIKIYYETIDEILDIDLEEFINKVPYIGVEVDELEDEYLKLEYTPNRLDYGHPSGIFKTFKGVYGIEKGLVKYQAKPPSKNYAIYVNNSVSEIRPYILGFIVKNINLTDLDIEYLINFQEDLHRTIGRNRRKVSIGIHDLDRIKPPIYYKTEDGNFQFIPLGSHEKMSINDILTRHPKGVEYGHLLFGKDRYPILLDSEGTVLSMPPIINSIHTQVTTSTRNLFIDITGLDLKAIEQTAVLLATTLADIGGEIFQLESITDEETFKAPSFKYEKMTIEKEFINRMLGLSLKEEEIIDGLERMRFGVKMISDKSNTFEVIIPPYRLDILHKVDLVEDISIGIGFWKIQPTLKGMFFSQAKHLEIEDFITKKIIPSLIGLGFIETMNMMLINIDQQMKNIKYEKIIPVTVKNPKTSRNSIRYLLLPGLLETISRNINEEYPLKIFEVGWVVEENLKEELKLGIIIGDYRVNYGDIKSVVDSILSDLGLKDKAKFSKTSKPFLLNGRSADLYLNDECVGFLGEVNPEVLLNFNINIPIAMAEIYLKPLFKIYQEK